MIVPRMFVCNSFLISVCMFIVSKALLISSVTVIVRAVGGGGGIWLIHFAMVNRRIRWRTTNLFIYYYLKKIRLIYIQILHRTERYQIRLIGRGREISIYRNKLFKKMRNSDDDICSEKKCALKLTEGGAQSIYCDVCSKVYCLKCMGIQKKNFDFLSNSNNIKNGMQSMPKIVIHTDLSRKS